MIIDKGGRMQIVYPHSSFTSLPQPDSYEELYARSIDNPEKFWGEMAEQLLWYTPWKSVLDTSDAPFYRWFVGGRTNIVLNSLERHIKAGKGSRTAILWESEQGDNRSLTYTELEQETTRFAAVLKQLGVQKGDCIVIYMPRVPEQAIAMLGCAKIGAVHTVVFSGLSSEALKSRVVDSGARLLITADGGYFNNKTVKLKDIADRAVEDARSVEHVIVLRRTGEPIKWVGHRDHWWHELMDSQADAVCHTEAMDAEDPLFIIYTSGSTGTPKGLVHVVGGYTVDVFAVLKWVLDFREGDVLFCTSDAGWLVGHTITLYGALLHGITTLMYEGAPACPNPGRWWELVERHGVTILYTSPTAVRSLRRFGDEWPQAHRLSSLRLASVAGEPIDPQTWLWLYEVVGRKGCAVIDSWWQTETSRPMISNVPSMPAKPGSCGRPMPGVSIDVVSEDGTAVPPNSEGLLLLKNPWPGMARTIYGDSERYQREYWSRFPGCFYTGDTARVDEDGYVWILGRADDVIKASGYRLGSGELEAVLLKHSAVAEAAVVGVPDAIRGNAIHAFVVLREGSHQSAELAEDLRQHVANGVGPIAKPEKVHFISRLPKTRSGKIVRRILRAEILGEPLGDTSMLEE